MNNVSARLVFDRKHVATPTHNAPIQLVVTCKRKRVFIGSGIKVNSDQWDSKDSKVKNHPLATLHNRQLADMIANVYDYAYQSEKNKAMFSFEELTAILTGKKPPKAEFSFLLYMMKRLEARPISEETKRHQRCIFKALKEFGKIKSFSDITVQNIKLYDEFARKRCKKMSSVYGYHKVLKIFVREAYAEQLIPFNPYENMKLERGKSTDRKFLNKEELSLLETKQIENQCFRQVRDVFLFCCYTGLSYSDLIKFDFSNAAMIDGMYRIRDVRKKTGTPYNISLIDKAVDILRRYDFKLPTISNQKYNGYLKVVGAFCGINQHLTSHVARHTFATTITMANGVRIEVISKMLGHTDIKTTQIYAKICQPEVDREFERLNNIV